MTTYAFPTLSRRAPSEFSFGQRSNTVVHTSPLNGQVQTLELPGARWFMSLTLRNLQEPDRGLIEAWLAKLRGQANRFTAHDFSKPTPLGTMRGAPVTNGSTTAGATSFSLSAGVGQAGTTLLAGDKLNVGGELKMVVNAVTLNGSGIGTVDVEPPFRSTIGGGASVVWDKPAATFILTESEWRADVGQLTLPTYALDAVEVFA
jgi:hypothetical protein